MQELQIKEAYSHLFVWDKKSRAKLIDIHDHANPSHVLKTLIEKNCFYAYHLLQCICIIIFSIP